MGGRCIVPSLILTISSGVGGKELCGGSCSCLSGPVSCVGANLLQKWCAWGDVSVLVRLQLIATVGEVIVGGGFLWGT